MKIRTVYDLKPAFQGTLRPLTSLLARGGVTANQVTIAAALLSIAYGCWLCLDATNRIALAGLPLALFIRMALNAIDGMLAREHNQISKLGGLLNELGDVVSDAALYLPMAFHPAIDARLVVLFVLMAVLTEFTGVLTLVRAGDRRYDGPMGKSDRALFWGTAGFIGAIGIPFGNWFNGALLLCMLLLVLTAVNRARRGLS